jgi:hypothetical protein
MTNNKQTIYSFEPDNQFAFEQSMDTQKQTAVINNEYATTSTNSILDFQKGSLETEIELTHNRPKVFILQIPEGDLKYNLKEYTSELERHLTAKSTLVTWISLFTSFFITFISTDFKNFILSAGSWRILCIILISGSFINCFIFSYKLYKNKQPDVKELLKKFKEQKE